ncbi:MAG: hypothetical protein M0R03_20680 [Novosphingobium sp.]|nr:hypothetical protein [Novosphingobium sp.]
MMDAIEEKEVNIECNFDLTNHDKELSDADDSLNNLKLKVIDAIVNKTLNDNVHLILYEEIIRVLDYVGRLSMQVFEINEELEKQYLFKYKKSPAMARELWLNHYDRLHRPYSLIKNRCFKLLDRLDMGYVDIYKKDPPNWKP